MIACVTCSCAPKTYYKVFRDGNLIEDRYYVKGRLKSIVAHNLSDTKDSIVYNGKIECYHWDDGEYISKEAYILEKFYYPDFDNSLRNHNIYRIITSHFLLENIMWSLASIDDETSNNINRNITKDASHCTVEYSNINTQCQLYDYLFQTYNTEILKQIKLFVDNGFLRKILLVGESTSKTVLFEYENNALFKEKIFYYKDGVENYNEEFTFIKGF